MRFRSKKGFTMVELVVVIAIIALLTAMIVPTLSSRESNKIRVTNGAKDFYVAAQHIFSKYAKQEIDITGKKPSDTDGTFVACYDRNFGGNRPIGKYVFIYAEYYNGRIVSIDACSNDSAAVAMAYVLSRDHRSTDPKEAASGNAKAFLDKILPELQTAFQAADGSYYALIEYDTALQQSTNLGSNLLKVAFAGYGDYQLPRYDSGDVESGAGGFEAYKQANLLVTDLGMISTGEYFGIQSSRKVAGTNDYIGENGTYFAL